MKLNLRKGVALLATAALLLTGCSNGNNDTDNKDNDKLKIAVVINTNLGDKAFSDLVWNGVTKAAQDMNLEAKAIELMGDATKQEPTLTELCESGEWDLIISGTFNLKEATQNAALEFPEQKFIVYDTEVDFAKADYSNVVSIMSKQNEGSFLAGAMAAMLTKETTDKTNAENVIGFVGGGENSAINDFLIGYIEGAKYIDPSTKVLFSYIGDFTNTAKGKELTLSQYQQGADIVYGVAGSASYGVLDAAKTNGKFAIGVDQDKAMQLEETDPDMANYIATSVLKNLDLMLYNKIKEVVDGTIVWGNHKAMGVAEKGMSLAENKYYEQNVPQHIRDQVKEIEVRIASGEIKVPTAIGMSTEEVNQYKQKAGQTN